MSSLIVITLYELENKIVLPNGPSRNESPVRVVRELCTNPFSRDHSNEATRKRDRERFANSAGQQLACTFSYIVPARLAPLPGMQKGKEMHAN